MTAGMVAVGPCFTHDGVFAFDPDRVQTVLIDPATNRPPDVSPDAVALDPSSPEVREAMARSVKRLLCPACCTALNAEARRRGLPALFDETDTSGGQVIE